MLPGTQAELGRPESGWRRRLYEIVFESETPEGRLFDKVLVVAILVSIAVVVVDSVPALHDRHPVALNAAEWFFTLLFTVEYVARLVSVERPLRYARSFFGIVDLLSVLPTYLAFFLPETHALIDVRILRLLRVFRIFKLTDYLVEYQMLAEALAASRRKILVFLSAVLMAVLILGTLLYVVEGPEHGFKDIPTSVYWAITTITTVGFGDITPKTDLGRFIASVMMLIGWGTLAVPTGIVTAEMTARRHRPMFLPRVCTQCGAAAATGDARYCHLCGTALPAEGASGA
ncbi:ion transporter [Ramlibacter sp. USB13]|uniref:Ion transporter n=1 Tax=Ramlibacter cellulosilyticus TaxID=2764187 RepID=A0A923MR41_9BURK|nr:ion transporter [Ramlibacter cellulosilyticus]MBC5784277.1 ion transporter [Ramlibacter cellulosilyticus]